LCLGKNDGGVVNGKWSDKFGWAERGFQGKD
jgi:hypothetical protein